ncbi:MAG TPA: imidazole glycerol phosphate synthase subunit HisH [Nitrospiria bacterium]|nr:imidazole glycerol phosphate synthase subunit HisH [Nitrospiria bacterium]
MIAIIDYGMGNLRSIHKAFEHVGHPAVVTRSATAIADASHVVLPGVGAFPDCMRNLDRFGLIEPIHRAIRSGKPFLGICLGLQLLFTEGEEFGPHPGLAVLKGRVVRFPDGGQGLKIPHMGWNQVKRVKPSALLNGMADGAYFYFVHSYYVVPEDQTLTATTTTYGLEFVSSIQQENLFACQFHPEKSQAAGLTVLRTFGVAR